MLSLGFRLTKFFYSRWWANCEEEKGSRQSSGQQCLKNPLHNHRGVEFHNRLRRNGYCAIAADFILVLLEYFNHIIFLKRIVLPLMQTVIPQLASWGNCSVRFGLDWLMRASSCKYSRMQVLNVVSRLSCTVQKNPFCIYFPWTSCWRLLERSGEMKNSSFRLCAKQLKSRTQ